MSNEKFPLINENSKPWYSNGLRFKCTGCGRCCGGSPGAIWINDEEIKTISSSLNLTDTEFRKRFTRIIDGKVSLIEKQNYDCIFLKDKKCSIYSIRPTQCRSFPFWSGILANQDTWNQAAITCEGISANAPIVPFSEIERWV
jgi:Fe-S-cluster containining protein